MAYPRRSYRPQKVDQQQAAALSLALASTPEAEARIRDFNQRVRRVDVGIPTAPKRTSGRRSTTEKGSEAERRARKICEDEGYFTHKSHESQGAADFIAVLRDDVPRGAGPEVRAVQVKMLTRFVASGLNSAVLRFLGLDGKHAPFPARGRMEACLWVSQLGWAAWVVVGRDGRVWGLQGPRVQEVVAAINESVERAKSKRSGARATRPTAAGTRTRKET